MDLKEAKALTFLGLAIAFMGYFVMDLVAATTLGVLIAAIGFVAWIVFDYKGRSNSSGSTE